MLEGEGLGRRGVCESAGGAPVHSCTCAYLGVCMC